MYRALGKRLFDLTAALGLLLISAPVHLLVALSVRVKLGAPVLFRQERAGRDGEIFELMKFRTMTDARRPGGELAPDRERLTPFGAWLRSTSLDELPALTNVVRGDMSLVGPRPLLPEYLRRYSPRQATRHRVRPGVTGLVQVTGRNALGWSQKFARDVWYVRNVGFCLDLWILWRTLAVVISRGGVSANEHATMPRFRGRSGRS